MLCPRSASTPPKSPRSQTKQPSVIDSSSCILDSNCHREGLVRDLLASGAQRQASASRPEHGTLMFILLRSATLSSPSPCRCPLTHPGGRPTHQKHWKCTKGNENFCSVRDISPDDHSSRLEVLNSPNTRPPQCRSSAFPSLMTLGPDSAELIMLVVGSSSSL